MIPRPFAPAAAPRRRLAPWALLAAAAPALVSAQPWTRQVERVVAALSQNRVAITADFSGSEIFVFGAIRREAPPPPGKLDVIVEIAGPPEALTVRRKERVMGVWMNRAAVRVDEAPSFYALASTGPLEEVLSYTDDLRHRIGINHKVRMIDAGPVDDPQAFRRAVIRLRREAGFYVEAPGGVRLLEDTLFTAHIGLPPDIVEGNYEARVFLLRDRRVTDVRKVAISVRKVGLERWVETLSRERPALYGALSLALALAAGWGASELVRAMRK